MAIIVIVTLLFLSFSICLLSVYYMLTICLLSSYLLHTISNTITKQPYDKKERKKVTKKERKNDIYKYLFLYISLNNV